MLLGHAHALVGAQLPCDLRVGAERLADAGLQGCSIGREVRATPVELDQRALHFALVRVLRKANERKEQKRRDQPDHRPSVRSRA
jgi:hypothetical protein